MNAALRNAARLAKDARLLIDADRLPSAVSLAILCIEEAGKISILRSLAFAENEQDLKTEWRIGLIPARIYSGFFPSWWPLEPDLSMTCAHCSTRIRITRICWIN
ncbi:AbiV family abortive infection protein [Pseudomonas moraviensis]|uniref:AbiV family abortive infection protein n=1 Tax=Pseudomonas moraviensis TaxID=321662 RepID=UPI003D1B18BF